MSKHKCCCWRLDWRYLPVIENPTVDVGRLISANEPLFVLANDVAVTGATDMHQARVVPAEDARLFRENHRRWQFVRQVVAIQFQVISCTVTTQLGASCSRQAYVRGGSVGNLRRGR